MVEVGEKCKECKYYSEWTLTCDYCFLTKRSRTITDGKKIDTKYCDKFVLGTRTIDKGNYVKAEFRMMKAEQQERGKK